MEFQKAYNDDICEFCVCLLGHSQILEIQIEKNQDYNSFYTKKES